MKNSQEVKNGQNINFEDLKIGSQLITHNESQVEVVEIKKEKGFKPLVVSNKGKIQYYHFDQIKEIL
tara:strand:- start:325 stop:525 length:201 start_codon:yes stop_codon:yes gene_type:complete